MKKPLRAALLSLPLIPIGSLLAHALAYRIAVPNGHAREQLYRDTGHGYLSYTPIFFSVCLAVVFVGVLLLARRFARGERGGAVPTWPFAVLPLVLFTVQEHAERFVHSGQFPLGAVLEPTFLPGLLLQLPVAAAMVVLARAFVRMAEGLGRFLAGSSRRPRRVSVPVVRFALAICEHPRIPALALRRAGRAPPVLAFAD